MPGLSAEMVWARKPKLNPLKGRVRRVQGGESCRSVSFNNLVERRGSVRPDVVGDMSGPVDGCCRNRHGTVSQPLGLGVEDQPGTPDRGNPVAVHLLKT